MDEIRPPIETIDGLAKLLDHTLTAPELSEEQVHQGCLLASAHGVAAVTVRPCDVELAVRTVGDGVAVSAVCAFPHGTSNTAVKLYEARDLLRRGAREIEAVVNTGSLLSRQFRHIENELLQLSRCCREAGALLKVVLEIGHLAEDHRIIACKIIRRVEAGMAVLATGFGPAAPSLDDVRFFAARLAGRASLKVGAGDWPLETCLELYSAGCSRIATVNTAALLAEWKQRLESQAAESQPAPQPPA
jgi:deoxyribose-phosphate aldolase